MYIHYVGTVYSTVGPFRDPVLYIQSTLLVVVRRYLDVGPNLGVGVSIWGIRSQTISWISGILGFRMSRSLEFQDILNP